MWLFGLSRTRIGRVDGDTGCNSGRIAPSEDVPAPGAGEVRRSEGDEAAILQTIKDAVTPESGHETHAPELPF